LPSRGPGVEEVVAGETCLSLQYQRPPMPI
jgi:hypothetical protein